MNQFQKDLLYAIAIDHGMRAYLFDTYVLVIDTCGEQYKAKTKDGLFKWLNY
jgi:ADP-glucose pyrophosphorylase